MTISYHLTSVSCNRFAPQIMWVDATARAKPPKTHASGRLGEEGGRAGSLLARPTTHRPTTNLPKIHASGGPNDKPTQIHASGGRVTSRAPNDTHHPNTHIGLQWQSASVWQQFAEDAKVIAGTYADLHMRQVRRLGWRRLAQISFEMVYMTVCSALVLLYFHRA